ncbi:hypothetical protein Mal35_46430 [Gimesia maris]|jgi:hypothetical protein|uniref:Carboxypeptidase regulatory-like domain-containing protein n=1 Tax=Gimesia maris TaxID=122 RepID=A0A3D3R7Z0_9PLAN|nr:hypothetical protein [Gimesia maris]MAC54583.1 hypothetical protein [Gimesia sp.]QDT81164.1 hypothetical protein Mal35_46430 [Gimesia maris]HCO24706.1 hypothetical protein [Gimesia maris]|tara:strand:- start:26932 stop:27345 length:414 start_codon:yes stop_codon:yes gene_type:complete
MRGLRFILILPVCFLLGCTGSDDAPARRIVTGNVLFQNQPIKNGTIRFIPQPSGPVASARIADGSYRVENKGGVPLGEHRIEIRSAAGGTELVEAEVMPEKNAAPVTVIPQKYNDNSNLNAVVESGDGAMQLDFTLD